jgi:hypothetical protein
LPDSLWNCFAIARQALKRTLIASEVAVLTLLGELSCSWKAAVKQCFLVYQAVSRNCLGKYGLAPVLLVSVGFLSLLHAQLECEAGEGFLCGVLAEPRPPFLGDPASSFHPCFALRGPFEGVSIFHDLIVAQAA